MYKYDKCFIIHKSDIKEYIYIYLNIYYIFSIPKNMVPVVGVGEFPS